MGKETWMKSIVTKYTEICAFCGRPRECCHHLIDGSGLRKLADRDSLTIPVCNMEHNLARKPEDRIHGNPIAMNLSEMLGQAIWESQYLAEMLAGEPNSKVSAEQFRDLAREAFRKRYGISFL